MKRELLSILALMLIGVTSAWADGDGSAENPWNCGDCKVTLIGGELTVSKASGTGAMADYTSAFYLPWKDSRNSITSIVVEEGVTHIGNYAFAQCRYATSIGLPSSLTSIGNYAFQGCNNASLTSITIPANVTSIGANAFQSCSKLTSITIPANVTSIGANAFQSCSSLTSVTIPNKVTSIGTQAFYGCSGLMTVSIGSGLTSLEKNVFGGCSGLTTLTIGSSVTTIGESAFYGCSGLTSVTIPNKVETIGDNAFNGCSGLQSLTIGSSVTSIGLRAFYNCANLTSVTIPNNVTSIGDMAFQRCTNLATANIGSGVTSIGTNVFSGCSNLTAFNVADGNTAFSSDGGVLFNKEKTTIVQYPVGKSGDSYDIPASVTSIGVYAFSGCANLTAVNIPSGVTSIGEYAFNNCSGLTSVTIPDNVLTIGTYTFFGCSGLTEVVIPDKVTSIADAAFYHCTGLTSVTIGSAVTSIGISGFRNCTSLTTVTVKAEECALGNSAFAYCDNLAAIYVPSGRVEYYKGATNWSAYSGIIHSVVASGYCGVPSVNDGKDVTWTLTEDDVLTIIGTGAMVDYANANASPWYSNINSITRIVVGEGVTHIGNRAFSHCEAATSIFLPTTLTSIGERGIEVCNNLTSVTIPENVKTIGSYAFQSCENLTSVSLPTTLTSIGQRAFASCSSLTLVTLKSSPVIGSYAIPSAATVTMNLTANSAGGAYWMTFYNQNYKFQADENTQIFKAALEGAGLTLTELTTDKIVNAGKPVILKSTAGTITMTLTSTASGNDFSSNSLEGVSAAAGLTAADPSTTFVLNNGAQGVGFYRLATGKTLGVGKAYLTYSSGGASAPEFLGFDGNTTGIEAIDNGQLTIDNEVYDLQGRKVAQPTKGLYIVNGKKVVIK